MGVYFNYCFIQTGRFFCADENFIIIDEIIAVLPAVLGNLPGKPGQVTFVIVFIQPSEIIEAWRLLAAVPTLFSNGEPLIQYTLLELRIFLPFSGIGYPAHMYKRQNSTQ